MNWILMKSRYNFHTKRNPTDPNHKSKRKRFFVPIWWGRRAILCGSTVSQGNWNKLPSTNQLLHVPVSGKITNLPEMLYLSLVFFFLVLFQWRLLQKDVFKFSSRRTPLIYWHFHILISTLGIHLSWFKMRSFKWIQTSYSFSWSNQSWTGQRGCNWRAIKQLVN